MITAISPERGGESQGILRVELSMPMSEAELRDLCDWLDQHGWSVEVDQINAFLQGEGIEA